MSKGGSWGGGRGSLNNRVGWKFYGYLISGEVLINGGMENREIIYWKRNKYKQTKNTNFKN